MSLRYIGYKTSFTVALALYATGTLLLIPGLQSGHYDIVLFGFFLIGAGFNFQIVAGNPLLSASGPEKTGSSRLNLGNALGAVAQIIAPASLSFIIPVSAVSVQSRVPWMEGLFGRAWRGAGHHCDFRARDQESSHAAQPCRAAGRFITGSQ